MCSVNGSGRFIGIAQMLSEFDSNADFNYWSQSGKWKGFFQVKWLIIKDVSNKTLKHITNELNEGKSIIHSRDTQEVSKKAGYEILNVFINSPYESSIVDDFHVYEKKQELEDLKSSNLLNTLQKSPNENDESEMTPSSMKDQPESKEENIRSVRKPSDPTKNNNYYFYEDFTKPSHNQLKKDLTMNDELNFNQIYNEPGSQFNPYGDPRKPYMYNMEESQLNMNPLIPPNMQLQFPMTQQMPLSQHGDSLLFNQMLQQQLGSSNYENSSYFNNSIEKNSLVYPNPKEGKVKKKKKNEKFKIPEPSNIDKVDLREYFNSLNQVQDPNVGEVRGNMLDDLRKVSSNLDFRELSDNYRSENDSQAEI